MKMERTLIKRSYTHQNSDKSMRIHEAGAACIFTLDSHLFGSIGIHVMHDIHKYPQNCVKYHDTLHEILFYTRVVWYDFHWGRLFV